MAPNRTIIIEIKDNHVTLTAPTGLEEFHNLADEMLYEYYQRSPSSLIDIPLSETERGDIAYYHALAEQLIKDMPASDIPIGKRVI